MRKIREILRLRYEVGLSARNIARSLNMGHSTVNDALARAAAAGLTWPLPDELSHSDIEDRLYPAPPQSDERRPTPEMLKIHTELKRKGVTLQTLWIEYKTEHPDGYQYSRFCDLYHEWRGSVDVVMRQTYRAGEKLFVDYAGMTAPVIDPATGEVKEAQVFLAVLGASNYTYAEATWTQSLEDWIGSHCRAFEFFGGVPEVVVPDNLKAGVSHASFYEPDMNPTYQDLATHYGVAIMPARPAKPRDKAKVEAGVLIAERSILARIRDRKFFSLGRLNEAIGEYLEKLNTKPFQKLPGSRRETFLGLDKPALRPLPGVRYEFAKWKKARVNIDYHIEVEQAFYSVPYQLRRKQVDVRVTATVVEAFHDGTRVASHLRSYVKGSYTTDPAHMPPAHARSLEWTPSRMVHWAESVGPNTGRLIQAILDSRVYPEQAYKSCMGIISLSKKYPKERVEAAAARALHFGTRSWRSVKSILEAKLDQRPLTPAEPAAPVPIHRNLRGPSYYSGKEVKTDAEPADTL